MICFSKTSFKSNQRGFTLLEMMLAMTLFALFCALAYGGLLQIWQNQARLIDNSAEQTSRAEAFSVLSRALQAGAKIKGSSTVIDLDYTAVDSPLAIKQPRQRLQLLDDRLVVIQGSQQRVLMTNLSDAYFQFFDQSQRKVRWQENESPSLIEFNWQKNNAMHRWLFEVD